MAVNKNDPSGASGRVERKWPMLWRCLVLQAPCRARPVPPARQAVVEMDVVVAAHQHGGKASED